MAMRTGKTKVVIDDFGRLEAEGNAQDLVVIAPAGVYKTWAGELETHADPMLYKRMNTLVWSADQVSQRAQRLQRQFLDNREKPRALMIDIEALSSVDRARQLVMEFAAARACYGAIDESTIIKNPDSKRSAFIIDKLRGHLNYRRIMSGLVAPNSPFDTWAQFYFLDPEILGGSYVNFKSYYAEIDRICLLPNVLLISKLERALMRETGGSGKVIKLPAGDRVNVADLGRQQILMELERRKVWVKTIPKIKRYRNEDELHRLIAPHSFRKTLAECYDMPPKVYMKREIELTKEQARIYKELKMQAFAELASKDFVTTKMVLDRMLRMHQVLCGHVKDEEGKFHEIPEYRTREVLAQLEDYDGKAVIWCTYDPDIRKVSAAIAKEYGPQAVVRFWGGNNKTREQEEAQFKKDPKCRFMVATESAGGRGRTWSVANLMLYYSTTNNLEHRMQSEERGEAVGKVDNVACVSIIAPGTLDDKYTEAIRKKINIAGVINGDNYKSWLI